MNRNYTYQDNCATATSDPLPTMEPLTAKLSEIHGNLMETKEALSALYERLFSVGVTRDAEIETAPPISIEDEVISDSQLSRAVLNLVLELKARIGV